MLRGGHHGGPGSQALIALGSLVLLALALAAAVLPGGAAAAARLTFVAQEGERGWVRLAVTGAPAGRVELLERFRGREELLAALAPTDGAVTVERAARWRCDRRLRHFRARVTGPDGAVALAAVAVRTPSCDGRLQVIVPAGERRPGARAQVRITDSWGHGGLRTVLCYGRVVGPAPRCRPVDLLRGRPQQVLSLPLGQGGRWLFTVGPRGGPRVRRTIKVGPRGGVRLLVSGDSMTFGIPAALRQLTGDRRATVAADTQPGTGITKPQFVNWEAHAYVVAREEQPDVSFLLLGAAGDRAPLVAPGGSVAECCGPAWVDAYARRVRVVMSRLLRRGRALVYWGLLPAPQATPEHPNRIVEWAAVNAAIAQAAATFADGVFALDDLQRVLTPAGVFQDTILYNGSELLVRDPDGLHLAPAGQQIAADLLFRRLQADGVL